jgi:SAM-dependent methyltransferase
MNGVMSNGTAPVTRSHTNAAGSDSSDCQIELARAAGLSVRLADSIDEISKAPALTWDCLIAIDFIEHLPKDGLIAFLAQAHRVLKPGGCLILRAPNGDSPFVGRNLFNDITHYWAYTSVAIEALLKMAGFQRVEFADGTVAGSYLSTRRIGRQAGDPHCARWRRSPTCAPMSRNLLRK